MLLRSIVMIVAALSLAVVAGCGADSVDRSGEAAVGSSSIGGADKSADIDDPYNIDDSYIGLSIPSPDVLCETPVVDVVIQPGQSIQSAVDANQPGTRYLLAAGIHRLQRVNPQTSDEFYGELDSSCNRLSVMNGARLIETWVQQGSVWFATGQDQSGQVNGWCEKGWERCVHPEDLYFDNTPLHHVGSIGEVASGKWFFDYDSDTVYLGDDPTGHVVEIGTTRVAFAANAKSGDAYAPTADNVKIVGLVIEKYASPSQMGAIGDQYPGVGWQIENNDVRLNHGFGLMVEANSVVNGNIVHNNGHLGIGGKGDDILVEGNEIYANNYAHVDSAWVAGGLKFSYTDRLIVRGNCVHDNRGPGIWTDIETRGTRHEGNVVFNNRNEGIFHEISYDAVIRNNLVGQNGKVTNWLYGAQILIATSSNANVYGNQIEVPADFGHGIVVIWQNRTKYPWDGGGLYSATGNNIYGNDVTFLSDAVIWKSWRAAMGIGAGVPIAQTEAYLQNAMYGNNYHMNDPAAPHFEWGKGASSFSELQTLGQEGNGSVDTQVTPLEWSCALSPPAG